MATTTVAPPPPVHTVYSGERSPTNGAYDERPRPLPPGLEKRGSIGSITRKSVPGHERQRSYPLNDIDEHSVQQSPFPIGRAQGTVEQYQQQLPFNGRVTSMVSTDSRDLQTPSPDLALNAPESSEARIQEPLVSPSFAPQHVMTHSVILQPQQAVISSGDSNRSSKSSGFEPEVRADGADTPASGSSTEPPREAMRPAKLYPQLQYFHQQVSDTPNGSSQSINDPYRRDSASSPSSSDGARPSRRHLDPSAAYQRATRPMSSYSSLSVDGRGRSPASSPNQRAVSTQSYDSRRSSFVDLTQPAHIAQQHHIAPVSTFDNSHLKASVGANASLLSNKQTLEMYRQNAKKTQDPGLQYELAVFMIQLAQQQGALEAAGNAPPSPSSRRKASAGGASDPYQDSHVDRKELLREARQILEKLSNRMPQAQYYLADAYASGLFNKGKEENEKAFPLFVAASKHGHAESGYRAALCYEFGWGCRKDPAKAVQFYRQAASKNHPGAMTRLGIACLRSDLGLQGKYREGVKWLKRATDVADEQYPSAPYELGCLHETGFGEDVFKEPSYAAQLFTQAAELGHTEAHFRMGEAYEHGLLNCPRDAALSIHFYTGAAQRGHPAAMMALCAWYLVGAEPLLDKNEEEAFFWAQKASGLGLPKAEYAVGYFTEMGIGCRRDPLEANVWYVRAADHGDERAIARLKIINDAASSGSGNMGKKKKPKSSVGASGNAGDAKARTLEKPNPAADGDKGDCVIM